MDKYNVNMDIKDKDNKTIFRVNCIMKEIDCKKILTHQLQFINELKKYTNLNISLQLTKI